MSKPASRLTLLLTGLLALPAALAQISFSDGSSALVNPSLRTGVAVAVSDVNGDGLDDVIRLGNADRLEIEWQQPGGSFVRYDHGTLPGTGAWGMCIADVDKNGFCDVFVGGRRDGLKVVRANAMGTAYTTTTLGGPAIFVQATSFSDIDNDGSIDMLICHDDDISSPYRNDGMGGLDYDAGLLVAAATLPGGDSGNYGIVWTDYDNDGDVDCYISKCRLGVSNPMDGRRVNLMFENDGMGNYADVADARGLRLYGQSWATDFGDIDNDGDMDAFVINHDINSALLENDGAGNFSNITAAAQIDGEVGALGSTGIQCKFADFDNDGFLDLLISGNGSQDRLLRNNGNRTFTRVPSPYPVPTRIHSFVTGDLNQDGFVDILAAFGQGYASPGTNADRILTNDGNSNNWVSFDLEGTVSNIDGIGARVELHGPWGVQVREVRGGEGYGIHHSFKAQFGIGSETSITSVMIRWPSGILTTIPSPAINTFHEVVEGQNLCSGICGDCNLDMSGPNAVDALVAARIAVEIMAPGPGQFGCCDVNDDTVVNVLDAFEMAKAGAGLPASFSCP